MKVRINGDRPVIVQDLDDIGLVQHHGARGSTERIVARVDDHSIARRVHRGSIGQCDVQRIFAVGGHMGDATGIGLSDEEGGPHAEGDPIRTWRVVHGVGCSQRDPGGVFERRPGVAIIRRRHQRLAGAGLKDIPIGATGRDSRDARLDDRYLKRGDAQTAVHRDQLRRIRSVDALDRDLEIAAVVVQPQRLIRHPRGCRLIAEHPLSIGIAIFVGGLRQAGGAREQQDGQQSKHPHPRSDVYDLEATHMSSSIAKI